MFGRFGKAVGHLLFALGFASLRSAAILFGSEHPYGIFTGGLVRPVGRHSSVLERGRRMLRVVALLCVASAAATRLLAHGTVGPAILLVLGGLLWWAPWSVSRPRF